MSDEYERIETKVVHAGEPEPRVQGAVVMPVFQTATYLYGGEERYDDVRYVRLNNTPNHHALGAKLAALENAEDALVAGSGMAAISTSLLTFLRAGDHLLAQNCLYGGTHEVIKSDLPALGVEVDTIDLHDPESWGSLVRPNTRVMYVESITNPLVQVGALDRVAAFAHEHGLVSMVDNTFASPVNFRPAECGFDLSLHSATKYLNGHSDIAAGAIIGKADLIERVRHRLNHLGGVLDPHACFLLQRGMKTLALRVRHQNASAQRIAEALREHPEVEVVNYPGLPEHPDHERAARLFRGFGGMLSFEVRGGVEAARKLTGAVRLAQDAPSLGGVESLITIPATTSHASLDAEELAAAGIPPGLVRLSVGIEATDDLVEDLLRALGD